MRAADNSPEDICKARETMNQARNEKQKAVLLREAIRLGRERFLRAAEKIRQECDRAQDLQSKRAARKRS